MPSTRFDFNPPAYLRSAHAQTVLSSKLIAKRLLPDEAYERNCETVTLTSRAGVRLQAKVNHAHGRAPLVILIHGWLGGADSNYVRRMAATFDADGLNVARLQLRDHGGTEGLNPEMFNSSRLDEVADACNQLASDHAIPAAIAGFSLGGNFALRLAASHQLTDNIKLCAGVCPAVNPTAAALAIDNGWFGYQTYFVRRWHQALKDKAAAFPGNYEFASALKLKSVATLTDYFVREHTPFNNADHYYDAYRLSANALAASKCATLVLAAADDPVIPSADFAAFAQHPDINYAESPFGGHCGFIETLAGHSPVDPWLLANVRSAINAS